MRPPAVEKMGYYPTDEPVVEIIQSWVENPCGKSARLLDPCAGEGRAASILRRALGCEAWGVELSYARAPKAGAVLDKVLNCAWETVVATNESVSLLFLNPPYETDRENKRVEISFLKSATPRLMRGGLLIYIVPQHILKLKELAGYLASHYDTFQIFRFPDGLYERFKQVVLFGVRRTQAYRPTGEDVERIQSWGLEELPQLSAVDQPRYSLLAAPEKAIFKRSDWSDEEIVDATKACGAHRTAAWLDLINPDWSHREALHTVMPLKKGHIAMLMASGMMGTLRLNDDEGRPMLVKGCVVKKTVEVSREENDGTETIKYRDVFVTTVVVIGANGIEEYSDKTLKEFMLKYGDQIANHITNALRPLYNLDPSPQECKLLDTLATERKPLPGMEKPGLLPVQRHAVCAASRRLRVGNFVNLQGEMGLGKTTVGAATIEMMDAYPALVICPPHLVGKWIREIESTIPGSKAIEIRRIGRSSGEAEDVNDVRVFLDDWRSGRLPHKSVAVVAHTSAKMGPGWRPAFQKRWLRDGDMLIKAAACPSCGCFLENQQGAPIKELSSERRQFCPRCKAPLFELGGIRRWSLAEYIAKHEKGSFAMLVADEVHEFQAKSSDRGVAFHQLVKASRKTMTLTGTFFGGRSTSIFWLLYRLSGQVRQDFRFDDERRWVRLYGIEESVVRRRSNDDDGDGVWSANRRHSSMASEKPGVSPALIHRLLDNTIFLNLKDLGLNLPPFTEELVSIGMEDAQSHQYHEMERAMRGLAVSSRRFLSSWLQWSLARPNSAFRDEEIVLTEGKGRQLLKQKLMELPSVASGLLPKESWVVSTCLAEKAQGRKTLVYIRQTGTRDIQDRIMKILKDAGLRVAILSGSVDARKREDWIAERAPLLDVLLCNAELVKTGLDLVMFSTVVFYEVIYSLYTLWQAVRRVYRPGQTHPVKAIFVTYQGALEETALMLMGAKMKAAQLLYGDEVGGALVPEEDGDLLTELARNVLTGKKLDDLQTLFADEMRVSHNPLGSMTLPSAPIVPLAPTQSWADWVREQRAHGAHATTATRRKAAVAPGQLGLL